MRKFIFIVFLLPLILFSRDNFVTLEGEVTLKNSSKPICGAEIYIGSKQKHTSSNPDGYYKIDSLKPGKYKLQCEYVGYPLHKKSITIKEGQTQKTMNFELSNGQRVPLNMPDHIKDYHKKMDGLGKNEKLKIEIDSIGHNYKYIYLSFINKSSHPLYLIDDLKSFSTVHTLLFSSKDRYLQPKSSNDSPQWKLDLERLPSNDHLIKLEAQDTISFPPVKIKQYNLQNNFSQGKYYIQVLYAFADYKNLPGKASQKYLKKEEIADSLKEIKYIFSRATRGSYRSDKYLFKIGKK